MADLTLPAHRSHYERNSDNLDSTNWPSTPSSARLSHPDSREAVTDAEPPNTLTGQRDDLASANENANCAGLVDTSSDLSWLGPLIDDGSGPATASKNLVAEPAPASAPSPTAVIHARPEIPAQTAPRPTSNNNNNNKAALRRPAADDAAAPEITTPNHPQSRKIISPGLAARLKALGLGANRKDSQPSNSKYHIGRLPEDQIRHLDEFHQQLAENTVIERRGRPWKGVVVRIPSKSSLKSAKSNKDAVTPEDVDVPTIQILESPGAEDHSALLSELEAPQDLDMDTNKYRLPDHANENGTKVTLDTRREHLERPTIRPPSPPQDDVPPPVPAKDSPKLPTSPPFEPDSFFNPLGLQRAGSIITISRASLANQLEQLTSLQLPDAESLAGKVAAIPTAQLAVKALIGAAEQIRSWIYKASEVISGLDSEDDVEWAAAGGREGLEEVETATTKFEGLINVYVTAIEELQNRHDIGEVSADDLTKAVMQMESIMEEWTNIRTTLRSVRGQVELAMEWEELWNKVLGEVQTELDELCRLVFEMEERRHRSAMAIASGDAVDIKDLETIVEETPGAARAKAAKRHTEIPASPGSPTPSGPTITADDSSLLALFARMQPLRASLDFLPMRLSAFEARAANSFPTACDELEMRSNNLDASYKKLERDAEGLRRELGEDRWVLVFRGSARQAEKMTESVERSVSRLKEAVDAGMHLTNQPAFLKKIESYEAKKTHYGPAIDRVLLIIDRGIKDRLTVNGEILRLHAEMQAKWANIKNQMKETDLVLDEIYTDKRGNNLRDSISSMVSNDMLSTVGSGVDTPYSSPPSSVIMSGLGIETRSPASKSTPGARARRSSSGVSSHAAQTGRRTTLAPAASIPRKPVARLSTYSGVSTPSRESSATPNSNRLAANIPRPASTLPYRPKWNSSTNTSNIDTGHNFKPLNLTTLSPYSGKRNTATPVRSHSSLAAPMGSRLPTRNTHRAASPSPGPETPPKPVSKLNLLQGPKITPGRRTSMLQPPIHSELGLSPRPASSLATTSSRRTSMLPMPKFRRGDTGTGRASPAPSQSFGSRFGLKRSDSLNKDKSAEKPRWRH